MEDVVERSAKARQRKATYNRHRLHKESCDCSMHPFTLMRTQANDVFFRRKPAAVPGCLWFFDETI